MNPFLISDVAAEIAHDGLGTLGQNIFINDIPATSENAIMVMASNSEAPDSYLDTQYLSVDVWVRNTSSAQAYSLLQSVFVLFHRRANYTLGTDWYIYFSHVMGNIEEMGRDAEDRKLAKLTLRFIYRNLSNIS